MRYRPTNRDTIAVAAKSDWPAGGGASRAGRVAAVAAVAAVALLAASTALISVPVVASSPPSPDAPSVNPHGDTGGCGACHALDVGRPASIDPRDVDRICLSCHDGKSAARESHPIDRSFDNPQVAPAPPGWPLSDGRLTCLTCHDVLAACRDPRPPAGRNRAFVRSFDPDRPAAFCATCHVESHQQRINPHDVLDAGGRPLAHACDFCHVAPAPSASALARLGDARLLGDELDLCGACHTTHVEYFEPGHLGAALTEPMLANLARLERRFHRSSINESAATLPSDGTPALAEEASAALGKSPSPPRLLPLNGRRVKCSTCHNPHPAGLFAEGSVLALGAMQMPPAASNMALRFGMGELCVACHNK